MSLCLRERNSVSQFFGCQSIRNGHFYRQSGVTISSEKIIFVFNSGNHCVQKFDFRVNFLAVFNLFYSSQMVQWLFSSRYSVSC